MSTYRRRLMVSQGKDIATRIKDSMVLWYDISRMLDGKLETYALSYANKFGVFIGNEVELYDSYLHITKLSYTSNSYKFGITDPGGSTTDIPAHEITITGIPEGLTLHFTGDERSNTTEDYDTIDFDITQDGTYQIPRLCNSEGLGLGSMYLYMFKANIPEGTTIDCDITITQTPISTTDPNTYMSSNPTLVDLSGNSYNATCYNFGWEGMSGIGGYGFPDLNTWIKNTSVTVDVITPNKVTIFKSSGTNGIRQRFSKNTTLKLHISNINTNSSVLIYRIHGGDVDDELLYTITEEGDYIIDFIYNPDDTFNMVLLSGLATFEQLPLYPNALVSDGVDDYCLAPTIPSLDSSQGFTIIAKREVIPGDEVLTAFASKQTDASESIGAFTIERGGVDATLGYRMQVNSFGLNNEITSGDKSGVMYCTSTDYNGETSLIKGDHIDNNTLVLFKLDGSSDTSYCGKYVLYSFLLFNRDLTQTEINWVKTNLIEGDYKFE